MAEDGAAVTFAAEFCAPVVPGLGNGTAGTIRPPLGPVGAPFGACAAADGARAATTSGLLSTGGGGPLAAAPAGVGVPVLLVGLASVAVDAFG